MSENRFAHKGMLAENDRFRLTYIQESDKDNYMETVIQNSTVPAAYSIPEYVDYEWNTTPGDDEYIFCITDKESGNYCGICNLRDVSSKTPEIGITLLSDYQAKGIGYQALKLMMSACAKLRSYDYYIAKVSSKNIHSQRLMEKLGAKQVGTEDSDFKQALKLLSEESEKMITQEIQNKQNRSLDEDWIIVYHLDAIEE